MHFKSIFNPIRYSLKPFLSSLLLLTFLFLSVGSRTIETPEQIVQKFNEYQQRYPQVKLTVHTNQPIYSPGDTINFSTWYTREDLSPISGQHVISFELRDESSVNRAAIRFKVIDGKGYNQLPIPATLTPGIYVLVAYSDWMKNFGESWYFQKPIQLVRDRALAVQRKDNEGISVIKNALEYWK